MHSQQTIFKNESVTQQTFRVVSEEQETSFSPTMIASLTCTIKNSLEQHKTLDSTTIPLYKQKNKNHKTSIATIFVDTENSNSKTYNRSSFS
jgi:hypothetical protein